MALYRFGTPDYQDEFECDDMGHAKNEAMLWILEGYDRLDHPYTVRVYVALISNIDDYTPQDIEHIDVEIPAILKAI